MSGLVFGCIAPHGGILIPGIDGPDGRKALATRAAMEELGQRLEAHRPDTIALITPHGMAVPGAFSLLDSGRVFGELGGNGRSISVEFRVDNELNAALADLGRERGVPVRRIVRGMPGSPASCLPLDWGATVPFWFMGRGLNPPPRVIVAAPHPDLDWNLYAPFGQLIRLAAEQLGRRLAFIASADLGHAHDPHGPYGYDPASAEYDAASCAAVREQDLGRPLHFDRAWVERAKCDALWQMLNLHGAIDGQGFRGELLSYEVPTYFGMLCAAYERVGS